MSAERRSRPRCRRPARLRAPYAPADEEIARRAARRGAARRRGRGADRARATRLVEAIRAEPAGSAASRISCAIFALHQGGAGADGAGRGAAARARCRDRRPADRGQARRRRLVATTRSKSTRLLVSASAWALGITARIIQPGETPENILESLGKRLGLPAVRTATRQAMRLLGSHFVLGQTIEEALARAADAPRIPLLLRHAGRGRAHRGRRGALFRSPMRDAIEAIGRRAGNARLPDRPGISVKLSALHPRYEAVSRERVLRELTPRVLELARKAKAHDLNFTVDAEEADRLELSLDVIGAVLAEPSLAGWDGFGLAVQAYQKRAGAVIDWLARCRAGARPPADGAPGQGRLLGHRDQARAGARACRLSGLHAQGDDRPLLHGLRAQLLARAAASLSAIRHPQRADRRERDRGGGRRRGLRVPAPARHGRGALRGADREEPGVACRVYAPVGGHRDLLAYLVRRLLENGANSSFVSVAADPAVPVDDNPEAAAGTGSRTPATRGIRASRCRAISMRPARTNSAGRRIRRPREP